MRNNMPDSEYFDGQQPKKKIKLTTESEDLDIWTSINAERLDIKALYQYIKSKDNSCQVVNKEGYSLLYFAVYNKSMEAIRILLLQPNINVNFLNGPHLESAIHVACVKKLSDAVELLIENGAVLDVKDALGHTPLFNAVFSNSIDCVKLLLKSGRGIDVLGTDKLGNTLLHIAASINFSEAIPLLIAHNIPVDIHNQRGLSPLAVAISLGYLDTANALIDNGADVNGRTKFATVLHYAVTWNRIEIIKKLVELNCNVNVVNLIEETPLYLAVQQRKVDIVKYLIQEANADPCYTLDPTNTTNLPLIYAANHGYTEICKLLITENTSKFSIQSSAEMAKRAGFPSTAKFLNDTIAGKSRQSSISIEGNNDLTSKDEEVAFDTLFNTFSDEE